jgi:DNA modification methylase
VILFRDDAITLHHGHALEVLKDLEPGSADCVVTSPPYFGHRDYGTPDQYGQEATPAEYVDRLVELMAEVRRVLADDGTLWLNLGDAYAGKANDGPTRDRHRGGGHKAGITTPQRNMLAHAPYKSMLGMPWRVALAMVDAGWTLRNEIIWSKTNGMPESVADRLSVKHEHVFLFAKSPRYWFDLDSIREPHSDVSVKRAQPHRTAPGRSHREGLPYEGVSNPQTMRLDQMNHPAGRNPGDVWSIPTAPFAAAHFATMPPALAERCVLAGCRPGGVVLDPFSGSGTSGMAATKHGRRYVGIDSNRDYLELSLRTRLSQSTIGEVPA